jgi:hypothetical protein
MTSTPAQRRGRFVWASPPSGQGIVKGTSSTKPVNRDPMRGVRGADRETEAGAVEVVEVEEPRVAAAMSTMPNDAPAESLLLRGGNVGVSQNCIQSAGL